MSAPLVPAVLRLRIGASRLLAGILLLAHGVAFACALLVLPGWWMPVAAGTAIAVSLVFHVRRDALQRSARAVTEMLLNDTAGCELILRDGSTQAGQIKGSTYVSPLLIVINLSVERSRMGRSVILLPDCAPAEELRRLRVWLRHRARPAAPVSGPL